MELSIILGLASGVIFLILGILFAGGSVLMFWDPSSVMITFGGCIAALLVGYSIPRLLLIPSLFRMCVFPVKYVADQLIITIGGNKMAITHVNLENFDKEVRDSKLPVLVDFYADWCG
ncbi:MAG: thioredoxin domain-containing protein, partial [Spirochaetes bacterium]|nr:thioredoxin domain-containing protein [Spirochaetota bacterium]